MTPAEIIRFLTLRTLGNFLVMVCLYGVVMTFGPVLKYELLYQIIQLRHVHFVVSSTTSSTSTTGNTGFEKQQENNLARDTRGTRNTLDTSHKTPGFADILAGNKE